MKHPKIPLIVVALVALTAFAGCIGDGDEGIEAETGTQKEPPAKSEDTKVTDATGSIKGEAMNVDFEPLGGAEVVLVETVGTDDEKSAIVAKDGSFVINEVTPGRYTIYVQAILHNPARASVDVVAGEVSEVSLLLEKIPDPDRKFVDQREYVGMVSYAAAWQAEGPAGCVVYETAVWTVKNCGGIRGGGSENGEVAIESHERAHTIFSAMIWDPAGPLGENLQLDLMCTDVPRGASGGAVLDTEHDCYFDTPGRTSPLIHRVDKAHWEEKGYNYTGNWASRVFATHGMLGTYESAKVDVGVAYEQTFTIFTEVWVNHAPPTDYTPLPDA